jgi:hypothetical protein
MRCYLMRKGHIGAIEFLTDGLDDALIEQGKRHFSRRYSERFDGFEVWHRQRFLYLYPPELERTISS